jgi:hypothetical protein
MYVTRRSHFENRTGSSLVDKRKRPTMQHNLKTAPAHFRGRRTDRGAIDRRIRAFLSGENHGEDVLGALYGRVAEEPIPERLRALLKR